MRAKHWFLVYGILIVIFIVSIWYLDSIDWSWNRILWWG